MGGPSKSPAGRSLSASNPAGSACALWVFIGLRTEFMRPFGMLLSVIKTLIALAAGSRFVP